MKRLCMVFLGCSMLMTGAHAASLDDDEIAQRLQALEQRSSAGSAAGMQVQLDEMREQMRVLNGKLEEAQHRAAKAQSDVLALSKDVEYRLQAMEQAQSATGGTAGGPTVNMGGAAPATTNSSTNSAPAQEPVSVSATTEKTEPDSAAPEFASAKEHYNYAFSLMNKARYAEAGDAFGSFVKKYPNDALVGNVYYWLGETWYVRGDYVKSADSFRQGFESMPQGNKAPDNLLKLAMSLGQMKQQKQSCVVLTQLLKKFPGPEISYAHVQRVSKKNKVVLGSNERRNALGVSEPS